MSPQLPSANSQLPTGSFLARHISLFRLCICGHPQWKHVAFSYGCREAGCHCEFFDEAPVASQKSKQP